MADERIRLQENATQSMAGVVASGLTGAGEIRNIRCDADGNIMANIMAGDIIISVGGTPEQFSGNASSGGFATITFSATSTGVLIDNPDTAATLTVQFDGATDFVIPPESSISGEFQIASIKIKSSVVSSAYQVIATTA